MRNALLLLSLALAPAASAQVIISEVYGGGGNTTGTYKSDYIILYNTGATAVDLSTWSYHYGAYNSTAWAKTDLTGTIQPHSYYVIKAYTGDGVADFPLTEDQSTGTSISALGGRVLLMKNQNTIPAGPAPTVDRADLLGWRPGATAYEGTGPAPQTSSTTSARRANNGTQDTDNNSADFSSFTLGTPLPVEMVDFMARADNGHIRLSWATASETNNAGFRIEGRTGENADWTTLGTLASKATGGTSTEAHDYSFVTGRMPAGRYEVRVLQNDLDGTVTVSAVTDVEVALDDAYELLVRGTQAVTLRVAEPQRVTVRLFDVTGREVARLHEGNLDGAATMALPQDLAAGMYLVRVEGERFAATRSVVLR